MAEDGDESDWLTEMDQEIINVLGTNLILSPSIIAENIERSRRGVSNRLSALQAGGLVEKVERGKYELTEKGYRQMNEWSDIDDEYQPWHGKSPEELSDETDGSES